MMKQLLFFPVLLAFVMMFGCGEKPEAGTTSGELTPEEKESFAKKGKGIALATFATLSAELGKALEEGGVQKAVSVCNISAMPLVDSLSKVHQAHIRRTSLKIRNPQNKPTADELSILESYLEELGSGKELQAKVETVNGMVAFYAPITTQPLCLSCHGKLGETLKEEDYAFIKGLYPFDQAIGYGQPEFRGIWSIKFEN